MLFNQGDAAIVFSGPWFLSEISESIPYALAPLPVIDEAIEIAKKYGAGESARFVNGVLDRAAADIKREVDEG